MKRVIAFVLSVASCFGLSACNSAKKREISDYSWNMTTIQSIEKNGDYIAYAPSDGGLDEGNYSNAVALNMTCSAKNGTFFIIDKTNGKTYDGTYKLTASTYESAIYEILIEEKSGNAVLSATNYRNGAKILTLIISIGDYVLNFAAA